MMYKLLKKQTKQICTILSLLILLISCTVQDEPYLSIEQSRNEIAFKEFAEKHFTLSQKLWTYLKDERNINVNILLNNDLNSSKTFADVLMEAGIKNYSRVSDIYLEIYENANSFLSLNEEYARIDKKEFEQLLFIEVTSLQNSFRKITQNRNNNCLETYNTDVGRCETAWTIAMGVQIVGAFFTGGISLLSMGTSGALFILCLENAASDYENCLDQ